MGYTPYELLIIIPNNLNLTFDSVVSTLESFFATINEPHAIMRINEKSVHIRNTRMDEWNLCVDWEDEDWVLEEMREFADLFAKERDDYEQIATCCQRMSTGGEEDDPNMDYFNTYVWMINAFETIPGLIIFDPQGGGFIEDK